MTDKDVKDNSGRSFVGARNGLFAALGAIALTMTSAVTAEVRIAAFEEGMGFDSLMAGDLPAAALALPESAQSYLDYSDSNNLCVLQILQRKDAAAIKSCHRALRQLGSSVERVHRKRSLKAQIYSNLGVAQMLAGFIPDAQDSLTKARFLSVYGETGDSVDNPRVNQAELKARMVAAN